MYLKRVERIKITMGSVSYNYKLYDFCIRSQKLLKDLNYFKPYHERGIKLQASVLRNLNLLYNKWCVVTVNNEDISVSQINIELLTLSNEIMLSYVNQQGESIILGTYNVLPDLFYIATVILPKYMLEEE